MVKVYAAEMLSILLQNEENQKIVGEKKGVDILLKQLAYFKKRNPKGPFFYSLSFGRSYFWLRSRRNRANGELVQFPLSCCPVRSE